jgi:trigger factor
MQLQKEVKKEENAKISLQVKVGKSSVNEAWEEIINDFEKGAKVPGFRKGRVPRQVVISRFEKSIKNETISTVLTRSITQILKEEDVKPISEPVVTEMGDLSLDEDFSFKAEFDVMPEIDLKEYKGIESEKFIYTVGKDLVSKEIENLRDRFATLESLDGKSEIGHYIVIDYEELTPEGTAKDKKKDQTVFLENKEDQLTKQLVGLSKGDEKTVTITQTYSEEEKEKQHSVQLEVTVNDVKTKILPDLNDDFAKDISDVDTLDELKDKIHKELEKEAANLSEEKTKAELMKKIIDKTKIELPETMLNSEIDRLLYEIASAYRFDVEKIKKDQNQYQEYRKNLLPRAENNLKQELTLAEVARRENLNVTDKEADADIKSYSKNAKKDFQTVKDTMVENGSIGNLKYRLKLNKALDFLYKDAKLNKVKKLKYDDTIEGGNK